MQLPPKYQRLLVILDRLHNKQPAKDSLSAYKMIADTIIEVENEFFGPESSNLHLSDPHLGRMTAPTLDNIFSVPDYNGVSILISTNQVTFISKSGAIEIQKKNREDKYGEIISFSQRTELVLFKKNDSSGHGVWHKKNK
ncbi:MAG: hypothetical protein WCG55_01520 [bacterium]